MGLEDLKKLEDINIEEADVDSVETWYDVKTNFGVFRIHEISRKSPLNVESYEVFDSDGNQLDPEKVALIAEAFGLWWGEKNTQYH